MTRIVIFMGWNMVVHVNVKQLGKRKNVVDSIPFVYDIVPETVEQLITETVGICVASYIERVNDKDKLQILEEKDINSMAGVGKIAFGLSYGENVPDTKIAVETAITAFEDGLYRIFLGEEELETLQQSIKLEEGQNLTFIRLTMLAGRLW